MIIDSHCHLDYEPMFSDLESVVKRAKDSNVKFMLTISVVEKKYETKRMLAKKLQALCKKYKTPFIINDDVELAKEISADGVHLGKYDM